MYKSRESIKIGGSSSKIDIVHIKVCAEKLGLTRKIKGQTYHLYAAGTWEWANHTAKKLRNGREKGIEAVAVPFADPELFYKAVYVRVSGRK